MVGRLLSSMTVIGLVLTGCSSDSGETGNASSGGANASAGRSGAVGGATGVTAGGVGQTQGGTLPIGGALTATSGGVAPAQGGTLASGGSETSSSGLAGSSGGQSATSAVVGGSPAGGASSGGETVPAGAGGIGNSTEAQTVAIAGSGPRPNHACGNGVLDSGEECDDGNNRDDDGCNTSCRYGCHTVADCEDSNLCTIDTCAPTAHGWACTNVVDVGYACSDGNDCTSDDRCSPNAECSPGTNECACKTAADCATFEDGDRCNGTLTCKSGRCEINPATIVSCDTTNDNDCRHSVCAPATGVCSLVDETNGKSCNDGLFCTTNDSCQSGNCVGSGNPCSNLACADGCNETERHCITSGQSRRCRPAVSSCDVAEYCDGLSLECPSDVVKTAGTVCRPASGLCDLQESCNGVSPICPSDSVRTAGAVCRAAQGQCDEPEVCDGAGADCPSDVRVVVGSICRAAAGECDVAESCDGNDVDCPPDGRKPAGTECRPKAGACDQAEICGTELSCPADAFVPAGTVCRLATGQCDLTESCEGTSASCPANSFQTAGTACSDGNACTVNESCDGLGACTVANAVPPPVPSPLWPPRGWLTGSTRADPTRMIQRPIFRWLAATNDGCGEVTYNIQVDDSCSATNFSNCTFPSPEQNVVGIAKTSWQPDVALAVSSTLPVGTRYFWRIRACRNGACSEWSKIRYLDVGRVANDLDGDGYSEVIVGAPDLDNLGSVFVYAGSAFGVMTDSPRQLAPPAADVGQHFGIAVSTGDLNADGFSDLIVAAPNQPNKAGADVGEVYVYLGSSTGLKSTPDHILAAPEGQAGSRFGQALDAESDINGDGLADIVVGAPGHDVVATDTGRAFVYLGHATDVVSAAPWIVDNPSADASANFGTAVATGDVTGDGFGDLAVSAPGAARLHILFGSGSQVLPQVPGAVLTQFSSIDQPTIQMSGDHDSDGRIDLIAGRFGWCCYAERLHVYSGSATGPNLGFNWDRGVYYVGEFGRATANGGDFNGDGRHEIVQGMPARWDGGPGLVEIATANANGFAAGPTTIDNPTAYSGGRFGEWLSVRGDVNGDGFAELIVGAPEQNDVFVYPGSTTGIVSSAYTRLMNKGKFGRGMPH